MIIHVCDSSGQCRPYNNTTTAHTCIAQSANTFLHLNHWKLKRLHVQLLVQMIWIHTTSIYSKIKTTVFLHATQLSMRTYICPHDRPWTMYVATLKGSITPLCKKSVITFIHLQHAPQGDRKRKKMAATRLMGQAMKIRTKNQMTAHSHWSAIFVAVCLVGGVCYFGIQCTLTWGQNEYI